VLGNLFTEMNAAGVTPGGQFKGTPYFNGGLFAQIPRLELQGEAACLSRRSKQAKVSG
jgi:hypothetical protein